MLVAALSSFLSVFVLVHYPPATAWYLAKFALAQWTPYPFLDLSHRWQQEAWDHWEEKYLPKLLQAKNTTGSSEDTNDNHNLHTAILDIPTVQVQEFGANPKKLLQYLESTYGVNWRSKPLLLKGLWNVDDLRSNTTRRLSEAGLLQEELDIPYFQDARVIGALSPNGKAPVKDIVANITMHGAPHKIGTQFLVQTYPELIQEVAPVDIVTHLFGDHFQPQHVVGLLGLPFLPASTTVPLFVAGSQLPRDKKDDNDQRSSQTTPESDDTTTVAAEPFTGLHCEPIGNVAVQLEGEKQWTLVSPEYSLMIRPSASKDGRAFFVSGLTSDNELEVIPRYYATTHAGDALWVPTWTWHRVDYRMSRKDEKDSSGERGRQTNENMPQVKTTRISIGASLFHLRPLELLGNNPLFAVLVIPNLVKEIFRFNTQ